MSNSINRQSLSDYEKDLAAWRKAAKAYNANVTEYNKVGGAYDAEVTQYNAKVEAFNNTNSYNQFLIDSGQAKLSQDGTGYYTQPQQGSSGKLSKMGAGGSPTITDRNGNVVSIPGSQGATNVSYAAPIYQSAGWDRITPASAADVGAPPVRPELQRPDKFAKDNVKGPSLTLQQEKDIAKSDSPLTDAERGEKGKFSPFKAEEGLVARAMKGFK